MHQTILTNLIWRRQPKDEGKSIHGSSCDFIPFKRELENFQKKIGKLLLRKS